MAKTLSMLTTLKGSLLEKFYPRGWDLKKIDACCEMNLKQLTTAKKSWAKDFKPVPVESVADMDQQMGNAIADQIESTRREGRRLAIILPVGPMGMYKHVVDRITRGDLILNISVTESSPPASKPEKTPPLETKKKRTGKS